MNQALSQMELGARIKALKESVLSTRAAQENYRQEEANLMDQLAQAEGEVLGKAPGWEGVELSGLIPEGENPHAPGMQPQGAPLLDPDDPDSTPDQLAQSQAQAGEEPEPSFLGQAGEPATKRRR